MSALVHVVHEPATGRMLRVCRWCNTLQGGVDCSPARDGLVTHGICLACVRVAFSELRPDGGAR